MKKINVRNSYKQRGALSAEAIMYTALIVVGLVFVASQSPNIMYKVNEFRFLYQSNEIAQAVFTSKKGRPNYDGYNITKVCQETNLSKSICGNSNNGANTNPFGGNWSVRPNASNKSFFDVVATIPQDSERIPSLANAVAPATRGNCNEASGCTSVSTTTNSISMTY